MKASGGDDDAVKEGIHRIARVRDRTGETVPERRDPQGARGVLPDAAEGAAVV